MLTLAQLNNLRSIHQAIAMPDTATIFRRTMVDNDRGGQKATYPSDGVDVACRLAFEGGNRPNRSDGNNGGRIEAAERFILTLPYGTEIAETDRAQVNGAMYEVVSIAASRSFETAIRLLVKRV